MKSALLVIDCQNDFLKDSSPYACQMFDDNLLKKIVQLISLCREKKIPIIYTQHSIKEDKSNAEIGEPSDVRACIIGTDGWKLVKSLSPKKGEFKVQKDKYDAFYGTDLNKILKNLGIDTLILSGVLTNNCVRATAEGAHYRGFNLLVVTDCCGATSYIKEVTDREIHDITLRDLEGRVYNTRLLNLEELRENEVL